MDISYTTLQNQQQATTSSREQLASNFDDFLTLLTTQLQNQDPLEPMDSTEFTNQLVAFAEVEQQISGNAKLDTLNAAMASGVFPAALGYIGLDVRYVGREFSADGATTPTPIAYALEGEAASATLYIKDASGAIVHREDLPVTEMSGQVAWDGRLASGDMARAGTYTADVEALDANGDAVDATTVVGGRARGVEMQDGVITAVVGERAVPVANILNATTPTQFATKQETP
ncbi:MAG TPA: flagellar hook capping family protein [Rhodospirillaceae bacterium]|jgi:flagellar basal-body rod modification protein FlgD|nr:flagellar hook capping family protein [Alphaproteobacteria bacterium]HBH26901.1 flagellar hook capping family protein [Rhodospirillaceae bacterium]